MLKDFCENLNNIPQLEYFEDVSIHAPWCGFKYGDNKKTKKVLDYLRHIDSSIPINRYVFNYDSILNIDILKAFEPKVIIRNPLISESWNKFSSSIRKNNISCAFDLNKAFRSNNHMPSMIDEVESLVSQVHISGFVDGKNRMPIIKTEQNHLLNHIGKFNLDKIALVIEGLFTPKDLSSINDELKLIANHQ